MSLEHQPLAVGSGDTVGTVRTCRCCDRPWVLKVIYRPTDVERRVLNEGDALAWRPESWWSRWRRLRWRPGCEFPTAPSVRLNREQREPLLKWSLETVTKPCPAPCCQAKEEADGGS